MKKSELANDLEMGQETLEQLFTAINQKLIEHDERFEKIDQRFDKLDNILATVLAMLKNYEEERKEVKAALWEHDRRILKLESN